MALFDKKEQSTEMENKTNLASNIAELRKRKGLTQEEFAEKLNVSAQAVSKWENGISCPDIMLLPEIAKIFGVTIDELMGTLKADSLNAEPIEIVDTSKLKLHIRVIDNNFPYKKPVDISVPVNFVLKVANMGVRISSLLGNINLDNIPINDIVEIIKSGATGEILNISTDDNKTVIIEIE